MAAKDKAKEMAPKEESDGIRGVTDARGRVIPSGAGVNAEGIQVAVTNPVAVAREAKADEINAVSPTKQEIAEDQFKQG